MRSYAADVCAWLLIPAATAVAQQPARHTITHEDVWMMKRVGAPVVSPDGRAILFSTMTYPGALTDSANRAAASERKGHKYVARVFESSPIRIWDHWLDDRKPSLWIQPLDPGAAARDILAGTQLAKTVGFGGQLGNAGESIAATWVHDGLAIVFAGTTNRNAWTYGDVVTALYTVLA